MEIIEGIKKRYSPMVFKSNLVDQESLEIILDAARLAASSYNEQPWRFIIGSNPDDDVYKKIHKVLIEYNQNWAVTAPVLMLVLAKKKFTNMPETLNKHSWYDTGMAVSSMVIQAASMGLQAHQMGGFDAEMARKDLKISDDYDIIAAVALGYPGNPDDLPELYRERAREPRTRKPIKEILL